MTPEQRAQEIAERWYSGHVDIDGEDELRVRGLSKIIAQALRDYAREQQPIPTSERLPEVGKRVLILVVWENETKWEFGRLERGTKVQWRWSIERIGVMRFESVSHWCELPPAPVPEAK